MFLSHGGWATALRAWTGAVGGRTQPCAESIVGTIWGGRGYAPSEPVASPDGEQIAFDVNNPNQASHTPFVLERKGKGWKVALIGIQSEPKTEQALELVKAGDMGDAQYDRFVP